MGIGEKPDSPLSRASGVTDEKDRALYLMKGGWVYIMTNKHNTTLYLGVTSNLTKRVLQHKKGVFPGSFTDRYLCHKLVWFQEFKSIIEAIAMEKRIKRWRRTWKEEMIRELNSGWSDLSEGWYHERDLE